MWLREGDRNTGFFHRMANSHRRGNYLAKIKSNGTYLSEEHEIQGVWLVLSRICLMKLCDWHPSLNGLDFERIGGEDAAKLEKAFSVEEVVFAF